MRSKVDCLRICNSGPILLIWPEGIWYQNVSPSRIEVIIKSHIIEGIPIKEWIFKETPLKFPITRLMNNSC
ncbi:Ferredoxin [Prochlorococcus sp. MIT 0602]|nr:Ferredoxin [Prochlorococcus sp. MIT 0602]KGG17836.1 Ferredoxin [Prochlorococcus sp. MIT 0603]